MEIALRRAGWQGAGGHPPMPHPMKRRLFLALALLASFAAGLGLPKERILLAASRRAGLSQDTVQRWVGPPDVVVRETEARQQLQRLELFTVERPVLPADPAEALYRELADDPRAQQLAGYFDGDFVDYLLIGDHGEIRRHVRLRRPKPQNC
jgi:hypothetical protein